MKYEFPKNGQKWMVQIRQDFCRECRDSDASQGLIRRSIYIAIADDISDFNATS